MSVVTKYYLGMPGSSDIVDAELTNVTILCVTRSGMTYSGGIISPANMEYVYDVSMGRIRFRDDFNGPAPDLPVSLADLEQISVKYKI